MSNNLVSNSVTGCFNVTLDDIVHASNLVEEHRQREISCVASEMEDIIVLVLSAGVNRSDIKIAIRKQDYSRHLQIGKHYERI